MQLYWLRGEGMCGAEDFMRVDWASVSLMVVGVVVWLLGLAVGLQGYRVVKRNGSRPKVFLTTTPLNLKP